MYLILLYVSEVLWVWRNPQEFNFVSLQLVQLLVGPIVFVMVVWVQTMIQNQKSENINTWHMLLKKIVMQYVRNFLEPREFHQHQWSFTASLVNRIKHVCTLLLPFWNKDWALKVKHTGVELTLLMKDGLETSNRSSNHSQTSGETQITHNQKKKKNRWAQSMVKCLRSPRNHHDRVPCGTSVTPVYYGDSIQKLRRKIHQKPTSIAWGWVTPWQCSPACRVYWNQKDALISMKSYLMLLVVPTWLHRTSTYS